MKCGEGLSGRMSVDQGDGRPQDGQVVEISPTVYSENIKVHNDGTKGTESEVTDAKTV